MVVTGVLSACGSIDEVTGPSTTVTPTTGPTPTTVNPTTVTPTTAPAYHSPSAPEVVAAGLMVGSSPDGSALYVSAVDPELSEIGCEGQLEPVLFRMPLDGGERRPMGQPGEPFWANVVQGGSGGRVALVKGCEEFIGSVRMAEETPDGHLRDIRDLGLGEAARGLAGITWSAGGDRLIAARTPLFGNDPGMVSIDVASAAVEDLFELDAPAYSVGQLADGSYLAAGEGRVSLLDPSGEVAATYEAIGFAVSRDGSAFLLWGRTLSLVRLPDTSAVTLAEAEGDTLGPAELAPDGTAAAFVTDQEAGQVSVVTLGDGRVTPVTSEPGRYVRVTFLGDGSGLAMNRLGEGAEEQVVLVSRFGR